MPEITCTHIFKLTEEKENILFRKVMIIGGYYINCCIHIVIVINWEEDFNLKGKFESGAISEQSFVSNSEYMRALEQRWHLLKQSLCWGPFLYRNELYFRRSSCWSRQPSHSRAANTLRNYYYSCNSLNLFELVERT